MHGKIIVKFMKHHFLLNKTNNVRISLKLRRVRLTILAVGKQWVLHILSVCL